MPLQLDELEFRYPGGTSLFLSYSASFDEGELVAVTGASGRGKSTLLYLMGLMLRPTAGDVLVDGQSAAGVPDAIRSRMRASFGFVFQDAALDATRSVMDNVLESALYRGVSRSSERPRALELMTRFGVRARPDARPGRVSGGQAQRVALCRALLGRPKFLLADEPTGNLDSISGAVVVDALHRHARAGGVVVVATHDPRVVEQCDRVVTL